VVVENSLTEEPIPDHDVRASVRQVVTVKTFDSEDQGGKRVCMESGLVEEDLGRPSASLTTSDSLKVQSCDTMERLKHSAHGDELGWMNFMMRVMWPHFRKVIQKKALNEMMERASLELSRHPEVRVEELKVDFDPGSTPPQLVGLRTYRRTHQSEQEFEGLQLDIDVIWEAADDFRVLPSVRATGPGGIPINLQEFGVTNVRLSGTASLVLAPLLPVEPCYGAQQVFFLDLPDLTFKLKGWERFPWMKKIAQTLVQKMTLNLLSDFLVLPHRTVVKTRKDISLETLVQVKSPLPLGILEVEVVKAKDLLALDSNLVSKPTSDPYVVIRIGDAEIRTSTFPGSVCPTWEDGPDFLPVYNLNQLVKISLYDDDVLTEDDSLGWVNALTVYNLCQKAKESDAEGMWLDVKAYDDSEDTKNAGQLMLRVRFLRLHRCCSDRHRFSMVDASSQKQRCPRVLTVKLLGMEGEITERFEGARATVEYKPKAVPRRKSEVNPEVDPKDVVKPSSFSDGISKLVSTLASGVSSVHRVAEKAKSMTGLGFGSRQRGVPNSARSSKATFWASVLQQQNHHSLRAMQLPPVAVRAIEQLHYREDMKLEKIAEVFGVDVETVKAAAGLRANFEVVWHHALHFLQLPGSNHLDGCIEISVSVPASRVNHNRKMVVDNGQAIKDEGAAAAAMIDSYGLVGTVRLDLCSDTMNPDLPWRRRVRARLRRSQKKGSLVIEPGHPDDNPQGEHQCDSSIGDVVPGVLIEFLVEIRCTSPADARDFLEEGQAIANNVLSSHGSMRPAVEVRGVSPGP